MTMTLENSKKTMNSLIENIVSLSDGEFRLIADLVYKRFGINLTEKKKALVKGRLHTLLKTKGFTSFRDYFEYVTNDKSGKALLSLIDRISTNHSYFFRESDHFDTLINVMIPQFLNKSTSQEKQELRIWSAGCATGEETYTLAMVLYNYFLQLDYRVDIGILGTDISVSALNNAITGVYKKNQLKNIPLMFRKFFKKKTEEEFIVDERIKKLILFKRLNLIQENYPFKGKFHVIFCRNVMIYFDRKTKIELINRFYRYLHKGGYLVIGHSESLGREAGGFQYIQPTIYRK